MQYHLIHIVNKVGKISYFSTDIKDTVRGGNVYVSGCEVMQINNGTLSLEENSMVKIIGLDVQNLPNFSNCMIDIITIEEENSVAAAMYRGFILRTEVHNNYIILQISPLTTALMRGIGVFFSPLCRVNFGNIACGKDAKLFSTSGVITAIKNNRNFTGNHSMQGKNNGYFDYGIITFTGADGYSFSTEISNNIDQNFTILFNPPQDVKVGDKYTMVAGCDKKLSTCVNKFNNGINFRGEPFIN
jgi:hypothetical protein